MPNEIGIISAVNQRESNKYGVKIKDEWYGGYGVCPVKKGDTASIEYKLNGKYRNIIKIEREKETEATPNMRDNVVDDIHLQVCLKAAAQILTGTKVPASEVAQYSRELLKELWG
ncbi:hypothetical protein C4573_06540 [Candidatus Woesearchaeota archaeon]|nr:MAG: hypothetical protein C4573_06540 [Candidatus Woesearchaeota archaeon]